MKKFTVMILIFTLTLIISGGTQSVIANDDREWQEVGSFWFSFGNSSGIINGTYYNGTGLNQNLPLSIALEGDGIVRKNLTFIKINLSNYVIFTLKLIPIPKIGRIWSGEYFATEEEIVAIYFLINDQSNEANYSRVSLTLSDPIGKDLFSQNLDLSNDITNLESPVLLNSSGLFKARLDFIVNDSSADSEKMWIFENVARWFDEDDEEKYLTFALGSNSNLSFQNYYERSIAVFSLSEIIGLQQMFLAEQQARHLNETANSVRDISAWTFPGIIFAGILTGVTGLVAGREINKHKEKIEGNKNLRGFRSEIISNISTLEEIAYSHQYGQTSPFLFKRDSYINMLNSGRVLDLDDAIRNKIRYSYHVMENYDYYIGYYIHVLNKHPADLAGDIRNILNDILQNLPD